METITKSKKQVKTVSKKKVRAKLVPGKTMEQIRLEAVRQLREMGILI